MCNHTTKDDILAKRDMFNEKEFESLRNIMGSIVLSWAQMEGSLTMLSHLVFSMVGNNRVSKVAPYECGRKARYLVLAIGRNDCFRSFAQDGIR